MKYYITLACIALLLSCAPEKPATSIESPTPYTINKTAKASDGMVVSAHPLATQVGIDILAAGGNAYDAMIATQFALAVVYPRAGNIGGGGFLVARLNDGSSMALDFREKAPKLAYRDMYLDSLGEVIPGLSRNGHLSSGVPGTVAGMYEIYDRLGSFDSFSALIEPAYQIAQNGFQISQAEADRLNTYKADFLTYNTRSNQFIEKEQWHAGDTLIQEDLAESLKRIMEQGPAGFYEGKTAELIVAEMGRSNGIMSLEDLKDYQAKWKIPVQGSYKDLNIISMPSPSSGGIALIQMLGMLEYLKLDELEHHDPLAMNALIEAMRIAFEDRANYLGDSDFYPVPVDRLLDRAYLDNRISSFSFGDAGQSDPKGHSGIRIELESFETTHTSIIDQEGHAASLTTTLNSNYGSKVLVDGAGFFLNNEMDDFSAKPGAANIYGLVGSEANAIAAEKRMLSSMTPTIIEKEGELYMVLGTPGGSAIITSILQVILNTTDFNMDLNDAIQSGRIHHQWLPDLIFCETDKLDTMLLNNLEEMGYKTAEIKSVSKVKAIQVLPDGVYYGVGDERNPDDHAQGINMN